MGKKNGSKRERSPKSCRGVVDSICSIAGVVDRKHNKGEENRDRTTREVDPSSETSNVHGKATRKGGEQLACEKEPCQPTDRRHRKGEEARVQKHSTEHEEKGTRLLPHVLQGGGITGLPRVRADPGGLRWHVEKEKHLKAEGIPSRVALNGGTQNPHNRTP